MDSRPRRRGHRTQLGQDAGFSLVELLIAATLLVGCLLSLFAMLDFAAARTLDTTQKETATGLAREALEDARALPFWQISPSALAGALQGLAPLRSTSPAPAWTVVRRQTTFSIAVSTCSVDDPRDGLGPHDATFCADGPPAGSSDLAPVDNKRVSADVSWQARGRTLHLALTSAIAPSALSDAPDVRSLTITSPGPSPITQSTTSVDFALQTSGTPSRVTWSVNGASAGDASGAGTAWSFSWPVYDRLDGTYAISATALDPYGSQGSSASSTVVLNRSAPAAITGANAGRNGQVVEAEWLAAPEGDIAGYKVYRGSSVGSATLACALTTALSCVDGSPPAQAGTPYYYWVVGVDRDPSGSLRDGAPSALTNVNIANRSPYSPSGLTGERRADGTIALGWTPSIGDPDAGDRVASYRIYRDGTAIASRVGRTSSGSDATWTDTNPGAGPHTYYVTAVDSHLAESALVGVRL